MVPMYKIVKAIPLDINIKKIVFSRLSLNKTTFDVNNPIALKHLERLLVSLGIPDNEVLAVAYEEPHFDRKSPGSYGKLLLHVYGVHKVLNRLYPCKVYSYKPTTIKASVGANRRPKGIVENAKEKVLRCLNETPALRDAIEGDLSNYSNDSLDGVLIAYTILIQAEALA